MELSPSNLSPIFLSPHDIKRKFEELDMLRILNDTCVPCKIPTTFVTSYSPNQQRRRTDWRGEKFCLKVGGAVQAILYWRKTPDGGEEYTVEQFIAPDGAWYVSDVVKHPTGVSSAE